MELKQEFVQLANQSNANMSQLCRRFDISRTTGYKWLRRWRAEGQEGLKKRSNRPKTSPNKTSEAIERLVVAARRQDPGWGGRKLRHHLRNQAKSGTIEASPDQIPAASTITTILERHGLLAEPESPQRQGPWKRFEAKAPNLIWQLDFKGEFRLKDGSLCYPLTLIDDHSRFSLSLHACPNQQRCTVQGQLKRVFTRYGLPQMLMCDNGPPWGAGLGWRDWGPFYTGLAVWMMRLGIHVHYCRPGHPQGKGKNERFNGSLKAELLRYKQFEDQNHAQQAMTDWRERYNTVRPHQALDMATPARHYQPSSVAFPEQLPPVKYNPADITRKVDARGRIRFDGHQFVVGTAFAGYPIALRASSESKQYEIYFCDQHIRTINLTNNHK